MKQPHPRHFALAVLIPCALAASACTIRIADLSLATNRLVELDRVDLDNLPTKRRIVGENTKFIPIIFPAPVLQPSLESAVDDALNKGEGDLLTDAVVEVRSLFVFVGVVNTIRVKADVVNTRGRVQEGP